MCTGFSAPSFTFRMNLFYLQLSVFYWSGFEKYSSSRKSLRDLYLEYAFSKSMLTAKGESTVLKTRQQLNKSHSFGIITSILAKKWDMKSVLIFSLS